MTQVERRSRGSRFVAYALIGIMLTAMGYGMGVWSAPVTSFGIDGSGNFHGNEVHVNDVVSEGDVHTSSLYVNGEKYYPESEASYVVWVDGATYYAKDGHTGAVTSNADAATLIQTVANSLTSGGTIFFNRGVYPISTPINIKYSNTSLKGQGAASTFYSLANSTIFIVDNTPTLIQKISISDLRFDGARGLNTLSNGIEILYTSDIKIDNCIFIEFPQSAIKADVWDTGGTGCYAITNNNFYNNYKAISGNELRDGIISNNNIGNTGAGVSATTAITLKNGSHQISLNHFWPQKTILSFWTPINVDISHNWFEGGVTGQCITSWVPNGETSINLVISSNQFYDAVGIDYTIALDLDTTGTYTGLQIKDNVASGTVTTALVIGASGTITNSIISGNSFVGGFGPLPASIKIYGNTGYITENSGTATLLNGQNHVHVTHGLSYTPTAGDISITFTEIPTNASTGWRVGNITAAEYIFFENDPGASNLDFSWSAHKTP